jgi:AraC family transcriptional regulator of adaptative response/methylated-DNA-[protein]-cysteine methyltransferase
MITAYATDDEKWAAILRRDPAADPLFRYSVRTTGVYCRPSCPSRPALRDNVRFHADGREARACGFRPCKRCRPDEPAPARVRHDAVVAACRTIAEAETPPSLAALAEAAGLSPSHFHRHFKSVTGLTPKAYATACRADRLRDALIHAPTVTDAFYDAGFNSSGPFYAAAGDLLGMNPSAYRTGAPGETIRYGCGRATLGTVLVAATRRGICAILLGDAADALADDLRRRFPKAEIGVADQDFERHVAAIVALIDDPGRDCALPLDVRGTVFQHRVWRALRAIPPGATRSYAEIAAALGLPKGARAVARACAANSLAVVIPCHRAVRGDGGLAGYRWGMDRKQALLDGEKKRRR